MKVTSSSYNFLCPRDFSAATPSEPCSPSQSEFLWTRLVSYSSTIYEKMISVHSYILSHQNICNLVNLGQYFIIKMIKQINQNRRFLSSFILELSQDYMNIGENMISIWFLNFSLFTFSSVASSRSCLQTSVVVSSFTVSRKVFSVVLTPYHPYSSDCSSSDYLCST